MGTKTTKLTKAAIEVVPNRSQVVLELAFPELVEALGAEGGDFQRLLCTPGPVRGFVSEREGTRG